MALWTPYAENTALDLSKPYKEKYDYSSPEHPVYRFGYYAPAPQVSPLSTTSISSYEIFTPQRSITPTQVPTLSPPISPAVNRSHSMIDDSLSDDPDFQAFEKDALRAMAEKNGGTLLGNNPRMRRAVRSNNDSNDDSYRRQRERNNFAAKQSRDRRKLREIHLALKVSYLRREIAGLKSVLASRLCDRCHQRCVC